jgi:hypothetical protein
MTLTTTDSDELHDGIGVRGRRELRPCLLPNGLEVC